MTSTPPSSSDLTDGPVLTLLNKRIRTLKKKLNRITQLEQSSLKNKEQQDLLNSKPFILSTLDELEKLRQPLISALNQQLTNNNIDNNLQNPNPNNNINNNVQNPNPNLDEVIEDLLKVIYLGSMFEVKTQNEFKSVMLTKSHERNCCLTYDYVTDDDDAGVMLGERDLDLISKLSCLMVSRPVDSSFSHQNALRNCVQHAKLWVQKSDQPIESDSSVTYALLREKLTKIMGSDYFKITPEMKATEVVAAEAAGNYGFQVPVQEERTDAPPHEQMEDNPTDFQRNETYEDQSIAVEDSPEHEPEAENSVETQVQVEQGEANAAGTEYKEQYVPRRSYHNQRGGGRNSGNGGRSGGRGYGSGRGGRSGGRGGFYQNGRNQYNEQSGNYYPSNQRNYYGGRGRGGRGNGGNGNGYNHHASGVEVSE